MVARLLVGIEVMLFTNTSVFLEGDPEAPFGSYVTVTVHFAYKVVLPVDWYVVNPEA
jgi:hypothetical protein